MEKRSSFGQIKKGSRLSETQYYEVIGVEKGSFREGGSVRVRNERGFEFTISRNIVEEGIYSADQFQEEVKVTRTEMVAVLEGAGDCIFTVNFHKQLSPKEMADKLNKIKSKNITQKAAKEALLGEERTLVGYLLNTEPKMGRSQVIDLEIDTELHRIRQVDHRTLNWIILKNVKYTLK